MEKNVKGFIGLFAGLTAFGCLIVSFIPLEQIQGSNGFKFYGDVNVRLAFIGFITAIIAIVFGALSKKHIDKKGPRKAGIIIGIFAVIISLFAMGITGICSVITNYANGKSTALVESMSQEERQQIDEFVASLKDGTFVQEK